jgi:hypothetical protein
MFAVAGVVQTTESQSTVDVLKYRRVRCLMLRIERTVYFPLPTVFVRHGAPMQLEVPMDETFRVE